jgi:hypothetical protein
METGNIYPPPHSTKHSRNDVNIIFKIEKVDRYLNLFKEMTLNYISVRLN